MGDLAARQAGPHDCHPVGAAELVAQPPGIREAVEHVQPGLVRGPARRRDRRGSGREDEAVVPEAFAGVGVDDPLLGVQGDCPASETPVDGATTVHPQQGVDRPLVPCEQAFGTGGAVVGRGGLVVQHDQIALVAEPPQLLHRGYAGAAGTDHHHTSSPLPTPAPGARVHVGHRVRSPAPCRPGRPGQRGQQERGLGGPSRPAPAGR